MYMIDILKKNRFFLLPYLIFFIAGIFLLMKYPKVQLHIILNEINSNFFDYFFKYITYLGDGVFAGFVIAILLFVRLRTFFFMCASSLVSLGVVFACKMFFFKEIIRPYTWFQYFEKYKLHLIDGVDMNGFNSFPSGHTMSAFCVFLGLALVAKNNWIKFLLFIIALLTGYSRVYLSQHFLMDIVAGSIIGVVFSIISFYFFSRINKQWLDQSLIEIIRQKK